MVVLKKPNETLGDAVRGDFVRWGDTVPKETDCEKLRDAAAVTICEIVTSEELLRVRWLVGDFDVLCVLRITRVFVRVH